MVKHSQTENSLSNQLLKEQINKTNFESKKAEIEFKILKKDFSKSFWRKEHFLRNVIIIIIGIFILWVFFLDAFLKIHRLSELELASLNKEIKKQQQMILSVTQAKNDVIRKYEDDITQLTQEKNSINDSLKYFTQLISDSNAYKLEEYNDLKAQVDRYENDIYSLKSRIESSQAIIKSFDEPFKTSVLGNLEGYGGITIDPAAYNILNVGYSGLTIDSALWNLHDDINIPFSLPLESSWDVFFVPQNKGIIEIEGRLVIDTSTYLNVSPIFFNPTPILNNSELLILDKETNTPMNWILQPGDSAANIFVNPDFKITPNK